MLTATESEEKLRVFFSPFLAMKCIQGAYHAAAVLCGDALGPQNIVKSLRSQKKQQPDDENSCG